MPALSLPNYMHACNRIVTELGEVYPLSVRSLRCQLHRIHRQEFASPKFHPFPFRAAASISPLTVGGSMARSDHDRKRDFAYWPNIQRAEGAKIGDLSPSPQRSEDI